MDNQQRKASETDLGWLAGMIDGEGTFIFHKRWYKSKDRVNPRYSIVPTFVITNTAPIALDRMVRILNELGLAHYIRWTTSCRRDKTVTRKKWELWIQGFRRLPPFLQVFRPLVTIKAAAMDVLLEFVASRSDERGPYKGGEHPYLPTDFALVDKLARLNRPYDFA